MDGFGTICDGFAVPAPENALEAEADEKAGAELDPVAALVVDRT